ncbi:MAG: hypothetical protein IKF16_02680 [Lachnospiraceae bacterium]|nr:hypothetical protein [Lachnospiraceae bacterium]
MIEGKMHGDLMMMSVDGGAPVPFGTLKDVTMTTTPKPAAVISNGELEKMLDGMKKLTTAFEMVIENAKISARLMKQLAGNDTNNDRKRWHIPMRRRWRLSKNRDRWNYKRQLWSMRKKFIHNHPAHYGYFRRWDE